MEHHSSKLIKLVVGQLQSNCYLYEVAQGKTVIIDPGDDDQYIIDKLTEHDLTPVAILATHGHFDHLLASFSLQATFNIPFYIHQLDDFLLTRMRETAIHFGETDPGPAPLVGTYFDEHTKDFSVLDTKFQIIQTPGHTPGSVSFYDAKKHIVFVGDLLFADGSIGEVTHAYSSRSATKSSIKKILNLPYETLVYSGHGEEASLTELKQKFEWALI